MNIERALVHLRKLLLDQSAIDSNSMQMNLIGLDHRALEEELFGYTLAETFNQFFEKQEAMSLSCLSVVDGQGLDCRYRHSDSTSSPVHGAVERLPQEAAEQKRIPRSLKSAEDRPGGGCSIDTAALAAIGDPRPGRTVTSI